MMLIVSKLTARQNENLKKKICQVFQRNGLRITIETNLSVVDFLDITLDLENDTFKPYMKPNSSILYVHVESNQPRNIVKNIPKSVNKRLSDLSKNEEILKNSVGPYQDALDKAGHKYKLHYAPSSETRNVRNRTRNIIWFNPPYCQSVKTNIGKQFFKIL